MRELGKMLAAIGIVKNKELEGEEGIGKAKGRGPHDGVKWRGVNKEGGGKKDGSEMEYMKGQV